MSINADLKVNKFKQLAFDKANILMYEDDKLLLCIFSL
jgi:hypothetical protein